MKARPYYLCWLRRVLSEIILDSSRSRTSCDVIHIFTWPGTDSTGEDGEERLQIAMDQQLRREDENEANHTDTFLGMDIVNVQQLSEHYDYN